MVALGNKEHIKNKNWSLDFAWCCFGLVFFSSLSIIVITSLEEERGILVLFVRLLNLPFFSFVCFVILLVSGKGCGL